MDLSVPEEVKELQRIAQDFIEKELIPLEKDLPERALDYPREDLLKLRQKAIGLKGCSFACSLGVPKQYGGIGLGLVGNCLVIEKVVQTPLAFEYYQIFGDLLGPHPALYSGTDYQKEKYLLPSIKGETLHWFSFTEPEHGCDLSSMETSAVREGDSYIINGSKTMVYDIQHWSKEARYGLVYASTNNEKGHQGISCFIVDSESPGLTVSRLIDTMGFDYMAEIAFNDCAIPVKNLLGEEGQGLYLGLNHLNRNRIMTGAILTGVGERCYSMAKEYAKIRSTWGKPLSERQAIQWMLADSIIYIDAMRRLYLNAAW